MPNLKFCELDRVMSGKRKGEYSHRNLIKNLTALRKDVVLNSLYYDDYNNRFGIDTHICCAFFDGFMSFMEELFEEDFGEKAYYGDGENCVMSYEEFFNKYDTIDNLIEWYYCHDEFGDE